MDDESKTDDVKDNDDAEATESDAPESTDSDSDAAEPTDSDSPEPAQDEEAPKPSKKRRKKIKSSGSARKAGTTSTAATSSSTSSGASGGGGQGWTMIMVGLVAGLAIGWFGRDIRKQAQEGLSASADPASVAPGGSAAPADGVNPVCKKWADAVCTGAGSKTQGCQQARGASKLLPAKACQGALAEVATTVTKIKSERASCDQLVTKLCKEIGEDTQSCKMVREKTPSFPVDQCNKMLQNYAKVVGELKKMEKKNAPLSEADALAQGAGDGPSFGPADAKVTVVEYSDFECPYCSRGADAVNELKKRYEGKSVRFVFRQFPLGFHKKAQLAAEASLAAHAQGKFWPMHDIMFKNAKQLGRESLEKYAKEAGLDMAKFKKALDDRTYKGQVEADMKLGASVGVGGTPTMFVGRKRVANPTAAAPVAKMIDAELAAAGVAVTKP